MVKIISNVRLNDNILSAIHLNKRNKNSFLLFDSNRVKNNIATWKNHFPLISPYYAIKSNNNPHMIKLLSDNNVNFDCASLNEIKSVRKLSSNEIIYSHPIKVFKYGEIKNFDVGYTVFDNVDRVTNELPYFLRIKVDDQFARCKMTNKFGADVDNIKQWVKLCRHRTNFIGFSFHVGSCNSNWKSYLHATDTIIDMANYAKTYGYNTRIMNVGGGFTSDLHNLKMISNVFNNVINNTAYKLIAEPGRFFSENSQLLVTKIHEVKYRATDNTYMYYINDSIYHNFSSKIYDKLTINTDFNLENKLDGKKYKSILFGITCDGLDVIQEDVYLPRLDIGDMIVFNNMGAYTNVSSSDFNGFAKSKIIVI